MFIVHCFKAPLNSVLIVIYETMVIVQTNALCTVLNGTLLLGLFSALTGLIYQMHLCTLNHPEFGQ